MSYIIIRSEDPLEPLTNEDYTVRFKYKSGRRADLGRSFGRMVIEMTDGNDVPLAFGDRVHINDKFTDSLWKNVRLADYQNNVKIQSSTQSLIQSVAFDIIQPNDNPVQGFPSLAKPAMNDDKTKNQINDGLVSTLPICIPINRPYDNGAVTNLANTIGYNFDDLNQHSYARWGETLEPFPLVAVDPTVEQKPEDPVISTLANASGLARLKRQFLYGSNQGGLLDINDPKRQGSTRTSNEVQYVYKPGWCDIFDGRKSYWTNDIEIFLTRATVTNSLQWQSSPVTGTGADNVNQTLLVNRNGAKIKIKEFEFVFYVDVNPTIVPRKIIWTTDLRSHLITSSYYNNMELIQGAYDFVLMSFVKVAPNRTKSSELCPYKSGLSLKMLNFFGDDGIGLPNMPLIDMVFHVNHGDSIVQIPSDERYRVASFKTGATIQESARVDLLMVYIEYLHACGLNPWNLTNARAKVDFNAFVSQMLYVPVSMRKDRKYWVADDESATGTAKLGCELNFDSERFQANEAASPPVRYQLNIVGFKRIFL